MEVQITYYSYLNFLAICPQCRQKISHLAGTAIEEKVNQEAYDCDEEEHGAKGNETKEEDSEERGLENAENDQKNTCVFAEESYCLVHEVNKVALPEDVVEASFRLEESITEDQESTVSHVSFEQFLLLRLSCDGQNQTLHFFNKSSTKSRS